MPALKDPPPPTAAQIAKWRREFEERGRDAIRDAIYSGQGIYPDAKRNEAIKWLREKKAADDKRGADTYWYVKWTWGAALAAAILAAMGILVAILHL